MRPPWTISGDVVWSVSGSFARDNSQGLMFAMTHKRQGDAAHVYGDQKEQRVGLRLFRRTHGSVHEALLKQADCRLPDATLGKRSLRRQSSILFG
jgi:hypothetical protein